MLSGYEVQSVFHHLLFRSLHPSFITAACDFSWINCVCFIVGDDVTEEPDSGNDNEAEESVRAPSPRWSTSPPYLAVPYCSNAANYLQPGLPPRLRSPRVRTAPPSPMRPRRVLEIPPGELAKQESVDELRTTVRLAACSMESSTKDIKLLGEKMAAATERMTETVQDNSQALVLLTRVVDRLQSLLAATRTEVNTSTPAGTEQDRPPVKSLKTGGQHPPLMHQSRCSFPSLPSFTSSSSSLSSSMDAPSTSQGTSCLSASCRGTSDAPPPHGKRTDQQAAERPLTNGLLDETKETSKAVKGGHTNQRKKRRKKDKRQRVSKEWTCWVDLQTHTVVVDIYLVCFPPLFVLCLFFTSSLSSHTWILHFRRKVTPRCFMDSHLYISDSIFSAPHHSRFICSVFIFSLLGSDYKEKRDHGRDFCCSCDPRRPGWPKRFVFLHSHIHC